MTVLKNQQENMKNEDDSDNFNKHHQDRIYLSRMCHVEEYAEDIKRQQRQNDGTYHSYDNFLKITCHIFQCVAVE